MRERCRETLLPPVEVHINRTYDPKRHGKWCRYCYDEMTRETATLDHIVPRAAGGGDGWRNLIWCCLRCNQLKADLPLEVFREKLSRITGYTMFAYERIEELWDDGYERFLKDNEPGRLKTPIAELLEAARARSKT